MKRPFIASCFGALIFLVGCCSLPVDKGRTEFLKGNYGASRFSMATVEAQHVDASQKSVAGITWEEVKKLFVRGEYTPMYRDVLQAYFYMALDALGEQRTDDAVVALEQMLAVHDQIAAQFAEPQDSEMSDEMKAKDLETVLELLPQPNTSTDFATEAEKFAAEQYNQKVEDARKKSEDAFNEIWGKAVAELQRTDQYAGNGLAQFYNPAAVLLSTFLNGFNGNPQALENAKANLTAVKGIAPLTSQLLWRCLEKSRDAFHGKVMVIVAGGHGPVLVSHNIDLKGIIGTKVFEFTDLLGKADSLSAHNANFDPLSPVTVEAGGQTFNTEVAMEMYNNLNAEFQRRKGRMMREQVIRVLIRDVAALASSITIGYEVAKKKGGEPDLLLEASLLARGFLLVSR